MQYTAMAVGQRDVAAGIDYLKHACLIGTPWISANIITSENEPLFAPWVVEETTNGKIGIIGLTSYDAQVPEGLTVTQWQRVLPDHIQSISKSCDFIILLSNLTDEQNAEIAKDYPEIHLIISANSHGGNIAPRLQNNTVITQTHTRGKYLGVLKVNWESELKMWKNTKQNLTAITSQLRERNEFNSETEQSNSILNKEINPNANLITQQSILNINSAISNQQQLSSFKFQFRALTGKIEKDEEISEITMQLKRAISQANKKIRSNTPAISHSEDTSPIDSSFKRFVGSNSCKSCHALQFTSWQTSNHAKAYTTLETKNQQYDLKCLNCHVTHDLNRNMTSADEIYLLGLPKELQSIGCESCHGPGEKHVASNGEANDFHIINESICRKCHTVAMDKTFNFKTALQHLNCP